MSTTADRVPLAQAYGCAERFRHLFDGSPVHRWEYAGSLRRGEASVGDIEHVICTGESVFHALDAMVAEEGLFDQAGPRAVSKAIYWSGGHQLHRWGDKYRGVMFEGVRHELFLATPLNFGLILAIRTGPAAFSRALVEAMNRGGMYRCEGGLVKIRATGTIVPVPTEAEFFGCCGLAWMPPETRRHAPEGAGSR